MTKRKAKPVCGNCPGYDDCDAKSGFQIEIIDPICDSRRRELEALEKIEELEEKLKIAATMLAELDCPDVSTIVKCPIEELEEESLIVDECTKCWLDLIDITYEKWQAESIAGE